VSRARRVRHGLIVGPTRLVTPVRLVTPTRPVTIEPSVNHGPMQRHRAAPMTVATTGGVIAVRAAMIVVRVSASKITSPRSCAARPSRKAQAKARRVRGCRGIDLM
jgi:hypothetical protein